MRKFEERRDRARRKRMSDVHLGFQMTSFDIGFQVLKYGLTLNRLELGQFQIQMFGLSKHVIWPNPTFQMKCLKPNKP